MEIVLTGQNFSAQDAASWGLISRVVEESEGHTVVDEAIKVAGKIASKGRVAVQAAKEGVNIAFELGLKDGLRAERRLFHQLFATVSCAWTGELRELIRLRQEDQKIGMNAFANKQKPTWTHK